MSSSCPNKEICGSCGWSHIPYQKQLEQKLSDINGSFALKKLNVRCEEILPSPKTEHYRNRMDFVIDFEGRVGLREKGKWWRVIDNHTCFLSDQRIEELFRFVRDWTKTAGLSFYDRKSHEGLLRYAVIRSTTLGETMVNIVTSAGDAEGALQKLARQKNFTTLIWSLNHSDSDISFGDELQVISGAGFIEEQILDWRYHISPNAFFQTNPHAAPLLLKTVLEFAGDISQTSVLDLYCGSGFFTIPFASRAQKTVGVESVLDAIRDARTNAKLNQVDVEFHDAKTEEFDWCALQPDLVLVDPPRSGMHDKALKDLIDARPPRIIYVSCNYKNLARELVELTKSYQVSHMRAVDMFPHTPHVEVITALDRLS